MSQRKPDPKNVAAKDSLESNSGQTNSPEVKNNKDVLELRLAYMALVSVLLLVVSLLLFFKEQYYGFQFLGAAILFFLFSVVCIKASVRQGKNSDSKISAKAAMVRKITVRIAVIFFALALLLAILLVVVFIIAGNQGAFS